MDLRAYNAAVHSQQRKDAAQTIVRVIFRELDGRGGFDAWWDSIEPDVQEDILVSIQRRVEVALP